MNKTELACRLSAAPLHQATNLKGAAQIETGDSVPTLMNSGCLVKGFLTSPSGIV